ncbi:hypothetical protein KKB99_01335, partial [bacterium]|nr:hypothetical protein [bacterium]MBU1024628.1 hypothetical protein [bacterium]
DHPIRYNIFRLKSETSDGFYKGRSYVLYSIKTKLDIVNNTDKYWYKVQAVYPNNQRSDKMGPDDGYKWRDCPLPPAPTGVSATEGTYDDRVRVTWTSVSGATSYKIYRDSVEIGTDSSSPYDDFTATPGTVYNYQVSAVNSCGEGPKSSPPDEGWRCLSLPAPTGVLASDGTYTDKVRVTWNSVYGATSYKIYRNSAPIGTDSSSPYDDFTATPGTHYNYQVSAVNSCGEGPKSSPPDEGWRCLSLPAPTGVSASQNYTDKIVVGWNSVSGAQSYNVYRDSWTSPFVTGITVPELYDYDFDQACETHQYEITAVNSCGESIHSERVTGKVIGDTTPPVVTLVSPYIDVDYPCMSLSHTRPNADGTFTCTFQFRAEDYESGIQQLRIQIRNSSGALSLEKEFNPSGCPDGYDRTWDWTFRPKDTNDWKWTVTIYAMNCCGYDSSIQKDFLTIFMPGNPTLASSLPTCGGVDEDYYGNSGHFLVGQKDFWGNPIYCKVDDVGSHVEVWDQSGDGGLAQYGFELSTSYFNPSNLFNFCVETNTTSSSSSWMADLFDWTWGTGGWKRQYGHSGNDLDWMFCFNKSYNWYRPDPGSYYVLSGIVVDPNTNCSVTVNAIGLYYENQH